MLRKALRRSFSILWVCWVLMGCQSDPSAPTAVPSPTLVVDTATPVSVPPTSTSLVPAPTATRVVETSPTPTATPLMLPPIAEGLQGLDIDTFFDVSYEHLLLRCPECVTALGLADKLGMRNDRLNDMSDAFIRETQDLEKAILTLLKTYDRDKLSPSQQVSYDVYTWYLEDQIQGHDFVYYDYVIRPGIIGYQDSLVHLFTELHTITDRDDVEDYIARLYGVETQMQQVVHGLERREQAGVMLPRFILQWLDYGMREMVNSAPEKTPFYTAFAEKLDAVAALSEAEKQDFLSEAEEAIRISVQPGFGALADVVKSQQQRANDEIGVSKFPYGEAYYAYVLKHYTTTGLTADEIHELGLQEVTRIHDEMRARFDVLGYPEGESLPALYKRVAKDSGSLRGEAILREYEAIIAAAQRDIVPAFDLLPKAEVTVAGVKYGGYYASPALDGSRPGTFYASTTGTEARFGMPTLAYHEAVPGHHLQIALAQELPLPFFRGDMSFVGYVEGWALYAEHLAWELGMYEDDPYGDLGRLQAEAFRAVRLVVDTGIHSKGWTYDQAVDYMIENTGMPRGAVEPQIWRYITWPGQATAYKIGMIKLLTLRERAEVILGEDFDLKAFHKVVLEHGSVPLSILERLVDEYIQAAQE